MGGFIIVNSNMSFEPNRKECDQTGRYGGVFKDEKGNLLNEYCYRIESVGCPTESNFEDDVIAGLAALKHGLKKCKKINLKLPRSIVESDDIMLVKWSPCAK
uniref:Uncharacterized protein n=1 Tax=Solanum tuberosum TaxID=4113 RepID=M1A619_SOLTU